MPRKPEKHLVEIQGVFLMQFCNLTTQCTAPASHSGIGYDVC